MPGIGTIVNVLAIIAGGLIGLLFKGGMKERYQDGIIKAMGLSSMFIGASGALPGMLVVENGSISTQGTMLLIFSLVFGCLLGEWINIEAKMETVGVKLKALAKVKNDSRFVDGFVTASLIICVGAMAIVGAMQDGLTGDSSMLIAKSLLDFVIVAVLAAAYGTGVVFSAIAIFVYQGIITVIAALFGAVISDILIAQLSFVGNTLIFCVGVNLVREKTFRVANMLPALLIPIEAEVYRVLFA